MFTVAEGAMIVGERARLTAELADTGAMIAVKSARSIVSDVVGSGVELAVVNGPQNYVLSGDPGAVTSAAAALRGRNVDVTDLPITRAFHSAHMETVSAALAEYLRSAGVNFVPPHTDLVSDTTGELISGVLTPGYWAEHTRKPVDFAAAVSTTVERGADLVIELGPGGLLELFENAEGVASGRRIPTVARANPVGSMDRALAQAWLTGCSVDWRATTQRPNVAIALPNYPFQHKNYWVSPDRGTTNSRVVSAPSPVVRNDLKTNRRRSADTPENDRGRLETLLQEELKTLLGLSASERLSPSTGLFDLGLTSAMVVELRDRIESVTGRPISSTVVFDHPTIERLAAHLATNANLPPESGTAPSRAPDASVPDPAQEVGGRVPGVEAPTQWELGTEPVAIVGIGCRLPGGANDPDAFWQLLARGLDGTSEVPRERWGIDDYVGLDRESTIGRVPTRAGFVDVRVDEFDADAFGISPMEARSMDPQQRLLLEVAMEALEDAGYGEDALRNSATGVYIGINTSDYMQLASSTGVTIDPYLATGNTFSVAAGRLSYHLGLQGPSMAVDTACSSSLVALHLALRSLRSGECNAALVGGVNLMLSPATTVSLNKLNALSSDGRCKPFSASADGYGRGEGCGVVVLKRLSDAVADDDHVWATVRGSAVNQDGRSAGLTVPNGPSQQAVIEAALRDGSVDPRSVTYVEAHGTGTPLGDPIEMNALVSALRSGKDRDAPISVGSAKSNLGHLEAAAGIAGLIKVALMLRHKQIPKTLHFDEPNPHIDWTAPLSIPTALSDWQPPGPRLAGLSSFGFSGTNAHVVLEEFRTTRSDAHRSTSTELLLLSARTEGGLSDTRQVYRDWLHKHAANVNWSDITRTAAVLRPHHAVRCAVLAKSAVSAADQLDAPADGALTGTVWPGNTPRLVFVFSGQGSQWPGMGSTLLADATARATLLHCETRIMELAGWSLLEQLTAGSADCLLEMTEIAQPAIVAVQIALVDLWRSWGIEPDAVVGHSVGELAAAYCNRSLDIDAVLEIAVNRGRVMRESRGQGAMLSVGCALDTALDLASAEADVVSVAAENSPVGTVLSGDKQALARIESVARSLGLSASWIQEEYAFHSYQMTSLRDQLIASISGISSSRPSVDTFSTVTGTKVPREFHYTSRYWAQNMTDRVRFKDAMSAACEGAESVTVVEIGPHGVLGSAVAQSCATDVERTTSMRRSMPVRDSMLRAAALLHVRGHDIDHASMQHISGKKVELPTYRWQRARHWLDVPASAVRAVRPDSLEGSLYEVNWEPSDSNPSGPGISELPEGGWLVLSSDEAMATSLVQEFTKRGEHANFVDFGGVAAELGSSDRGEMLRAWAGEVVRQHEPLRGVVHLGSRKISMFDDGIDLLSDAVALSCATALGAAAGLISHRTRAKLWIVTSGGVEAGATAIDLAEAPVWGLGRVIGLEHPEIWGGLIDLDPSDCDEACPVIADEVLEADGEDQIAFRRGQRLVARLRSTNLPHNDIQEPTISSERAYLVTGGRGTLGIRIADWLSSRGARHIILLGRSPVETNGGDEHGGRVEAAIARLKSVGVVVHSVVGDVADQLQMDQLFSPGQPWPRIGGVVHAAGSFVPSQLCDLDWALFDDTLHAKVRGTRAIEIASSRTPLDFLVLYSSGSAVWGSALAGHYAAANYFLDLTAHARSRAGMPTYAVGWGWFADSRMGSGHKSYFESMGLAAVPDSLAFAALDRLVGSSKPQLTVATVDWAQFKPVMEARRRRPLLARMKFDVDSAGAGTDFTSSIGVLQAYSVRKRITADALQREVAIVLGRDPASRLDPDTGFFSVGMDSISSVALKRRLDLMIGKAVPVTATFEHPTINELSVFVLEELLGYREQTEAVAEPEVDGLDSLSEEELLALLDRELEDNDH
ncbi:beta-ketoacyl synthase N-terminal-like domain-containing protein [Rhodococcus sp. NPDC077669]|uniref:beta-ketoacyl synthase N-terminal-like domain-containing protein n=1 Tax=Rhodococcus sp. NPDC077669 TaxID=3155174 RepID=UPI0034220B32